MPTLVEIVQEHTKQISQLNATIENLAKQHTVVNQQNVALHDQIKSLTERLTRTEHVIAAVLGVNANTKF